MIEFKNVNKSYFIRQKVKGPLAGIRSFFSGAKEEIKAVQDLSFHIPEGELLGYLGPNGAGKSTTIKMLAGILVPTSGEISVAGITPYKERKKTPGISGLFLAKGRSSGGICPWRILTSSIVNSTASRMKPLTVIMSMQWKAWG
jgi:ABC-type uncharacterized transport system ATPase subunit